MFTDSNFKCQRSLNYECWPRNKDCWTNELCRRGASSGEEEVIIEIGNGAAALGSMLVCALMLIGL